MSRIVRRVPYNWDHPKDVNGNYVPLLEHYEEKVREWDEAYAQWNNGFWTDYCGGWIPRTGNVLQMTFEAWYGPRPMACEYMPVWEMLEVEPTQYQMYEDTTEGTPISPVCASPEELAQWLVDHGASFFAGETTTYDHWLAISQDTVIGLPLLTFQIYEEK